MRGRRSIEVPGDHPVHLAQSVPITINDRSTHLRVGVTVEPLFSQHGDERGKKSGTQTCIKDRFNVDNGRIGTSPLGQNEMEVGWRVAEGDVGDNRKYNVARLGEIRLELALDVDNESGCYCREQASLFSQEIQINTTKEAGKKGEKTYED